MRQYHQTHPASSEPRGGPKASASTGLARFYVASLFVLAHALGGCAFSLPIATLSGGAAGDDDVTGTVPSARLEKMLDAEDWRRARAALSTALDPQGNGARVAWENPQSGAKGAFAPLGKPYPQDAKICRAFSTEVEQKAGTEQMRGLACFEKGGDWTIAELSPAKKG